MTGRQSASSRIDSSTACTMTGLKTLSWKLPCVPANATVASLPNTRVATIVIGLGLRRVDLARHDRADPGSFSGIRSSPMPLRGPEAQPAHVVGHLHQRRRRGCAATARPATSASWAREGREHVRRPGGRASPVSVAIFSAARSPNCGWALRPVPTAVPPMARSYEPGSTACGTARHARSRAARPSRRSPGRASSASRPAGACGRP